MMIKKQNQKIIPIKSEEELRQEISRQDQIKWEEKERIKKYLNKTTDYQIHLLDKLVANNKNYNRMILAIYLTLEAQKLLTFKEINQFNKISYKTMLSLIEELINFGLIKPIEFSHTQHNQKIFQLADKDGFYELVAIAKLNMEKFIK